MLYICIQFAVYINIWVHNYDFLLFVSISEKDKNTGNNVRHSLLYAD